jgi:GntR family transcriptional regulator, transcriptional repressor for pyruvate dehydrogenase complex
MSTTPSIQFNSVMRDPSLSDKVAELLTEAIVSKQFAPGQRLPSERDLGEQFGVSRTVIREAVRSLAARGLVTVTSGRGVQVGQLDSSNMTASLRLFVRGQGDLDYAKVHEVRTAVEVQAAVLAARRATKEQIKNLKKLCDDYEHSLAQQDLKMASELDVQFHRELARAADNELLVAMLDSISDVLQEVRNQGITHLSIAESGLKAHRWILECISAGDAEAARGAMEKHLAEAERLWREGTTTAAKSIKRSTKSVKS